MEKVLADFSCVFYVFFSVHSPLIKTNIFLRGFSWMGMEKFLRISGVSSTCPSTCSYPGSRLFCEFRWCLQRCAPTLVRVRGYPRWVVEKVLADFGGVFDVVFSVHSPLFKTDLFLRGFSRMGMEKFLRISEASFYVSFYVHLPWFETALRISRCR